MNRIEKEVASLKGATVIDAVALPQDGQWMPVLILKLADGRRVQVEGWQDPEGNGPGYLSIGAVEAERQAPSYQGEGLGQQPTGGPTFDQEHHTGRTEAHTHTYRCGCIVDHGDEPCTAPLRLPMNCQACAQPDEGLDQPFDKERRRQEAGVVAYCWTCRYCPSHTRRSGQITTHGLASDCPSPAPRRLTANARRHHPSGHDVREAGR
jgi:hypothetical protein